MDLILFLFQFIAALVDGMRSKWRYVAAFLLTDVLLVLAILVDGIYSTTFHGHIDQIAELFTTSAGWLLLVGVGAAGMAGVRLLIAMKI